jgi:hypothetical protein
MGRLVACCMLHVLIPHVFFCISPFADGSGTLDFDEFLMLFNKIDNGAALGGIFRTANKNVGRLPQKMGALNKERARFQTWKVTNRGKNSNTGDLLQQFRREETLETKRLLQRKKLEDREMKKYWKNTSMGSLFE